MGLKFRKRVTVFPGFTLNISKSGVSSTIGVKGMNVNFNKNGQYLNLGLPGTGIYDRIKIGGKNAGNIDFNTAEGIDYNKELDHEIKSLDVGNMSDEIGEQIKKDIKNSFEQRKNLKNELFIVEGKVIFLRLIFLVGGFLHKGYSKYVSESREMLKELKEVYKNSYVKLNVNFDQEGKKLHDELRESFLELSKCKKIWDITSAQDNDGVADRTGASKIVKRKETKIGFQAIDSINVEGEVLRFTNKNGGDIFLYPSHVAITDGKKIDIFDIRKLEISYFPDRMIEEERVPKDTEIIDYTWRYVNKNGGPDKRYSSNKKIPIVEYGKLCLDSDTGLYEEFVFSDYKKLDEFGENLEIYLKYLNGTVMKKIKKVSSLDDEIDINCTECECFIGSFSYNYLAEKGEVHCKQCDDVVPINISIK